MTSAFVADKKRIRAPSRRSLATRDRVLDAAEKIFALRGFDGATIRDIATEAGEPIGTIHHHGGGKETLFFQTVARRADALSQARLNALKLSKTEKLPDLESVLSAFMRPFFDLSMREPRWRHYARLVAYVSVDDRWRELTAEYFDPTAKIFIETIEEFLPHVSRSQVAEAFVFSVSAMLALLTSAKRIETLGTGPASQDSQIDHLIHFCAAGFRT